LKRFIYKINPVVFFLALIVITGAVAKPQANQNSIHGKISGTVLDNKTGRPLYGANIVINETVLGTASNQTGLYTIENIQPGQYDVTAMMIGYERMAEQIRVLPGQTTELNFSLTPTVIEQPNLIVTASKRKQLIENTPVSVEVVGRRQIQNRSVTQLDEVLQNTAGFGVTDGQIDLRGSTGFSWAAGSRVLVMLDGHPMITGDGGAINWDIIPVEEVERVEIVKGAGSALYGSNAMAGMINIITRDPSAKPVTRYKMGWGFYDEPAYSGWRWTDRFLTHQLFDLKKLPESPLTFEQFRLSHSRQIGKVGFLLTLGRNRSSGYQQNGNFSSWQAMLKTKIRFAPQKILTILGNWGLNNHGDTIMWQNQESPMTVPPEGLGDWVYYEKGNIQVTFQHAVNKKLGYTLKANIYRNNWQNHFHDNLDWAITDRMATEAQADYLMGRHALTFGSEVTYHYTESAIYSNHQTWDFSVYAEDELKLSPIWTFTFGTRYDYHNIPGISSDRQLSPRLGMVYKPAAGTSLRLSAGRGFRAPSIAEVFANISVSGFHVVPNLELKTAERANSFEIGIRQILLSPSKSKSSLSFSDNPVKWFFDRINPGFLFDAAVFWTEYYNMIEVSLEKEIKFDYLKRARIRGIECRVQGNLFQGFINLNLGYTYLDPVNLEDNEKLHYYAGQTLNYRSRHRLVTSLEFHSGRLTFGWDYRYASRIEEIFPIYLTDERVPMHVMDARLILALGSIQIGIEGKNIRNYHYTLRQRFLEPVRSYRLTLKGEF